MPYSLVFVFNRLIERGLARGSPAIVRGKEEEEEKLRAMRVLLEEVTRWVGVVRGLERAHVVPGGDGSVLEGEE